MSHPQRMLTTSEQVCPERRRCRFAQAGQVYAGNPDTQSLAHANSTVAVSQYDAACVRLSH
jgi:hypothetical protein